MSQPAAAHPTRSLYYTGTSSIDQTVSGQGDLATVILTLETSSETVKLDADDDADPFYLKVTARVTNSAKPASPITIATGTGKKRETPLSRSSNLARESSVAIDWGVLGEMVECTKPEKRILAPRWRVCGSWSAGGDLRAARHWDFVTLPSETSGNVFQIKHKYPMKRLRENGALPGETYSIGFGYWGQNTGYFVSVRRTRHQILLTTHSAGTSGAALTSSRAASSSTWANKKSCRSLVRHITRVRLWTKHTAGVYAIERTRNTAFNG